MIDICKRPTRGIVSKRMALTLLFSTLLAITAGLCTSLGATISGTVTDDYDPVTGVNVRLSGQVCFSCGYSCTACSPSYSGSAETAVDGSYTFTSLSSVPTYYISVPESPNTTDYLQQQQGFQFDNDDQVLQVDFHLMLASEISGTIRKSDGTTFTPEELANINVVAIEQNQNELNCFGAFLPCPIIIAMEPSYLGTVQPDGSYIIPFLPSGVGYRVIAMGNGTVNAIPEWSSGAISVNRCELSETVDISTSGIHIEGINFLLDSGATVEGHVSQTPQVTSKSLYLHADSGVGACEPEEFCMSADVLEGGSYSVTGLASGKYTMSARFNETTLLFRQEWVAGINTDSSPDCEQAEAITVSETTPNQVFSQRNLQIGTGGNISGTIYERPGKTADGDSYVVRFQDDCTTAQTVFEVTTETGSYFSPVLSPGDYYLSLLKADGSTVIGWRTSSETLTQSCAAAHAVHVEDNHTVIGMNFLLKPFSLVPVYQLILNDE